jgi:hypothetical protein
MKLGSCDVCDKTGWLSRAWVTGIETYACEECSGVAPEDREPIPPREGGTQRGASVRPGDTSEPKLGHHSDETSDAVGSPNFKETT